MAETARPTGATAESDTWCGRAIRDGGENNDEGATGAVVDGSMGDVPTREWELAGDGRPAVG